LFERVGVIVSETDKINVYKNIAALRVKFTTRPRKVFHKQSDVMILVATIQKGSEVVCSCSSDLIFRGGTGSLYKPESRHKSPEGGRKKIRSNESKNKKGNPTALHIHGVVEFEKNPFFKSLCPIGFHTQFEVLTDSARWLKYINKNAESNVAGSEYFRTNYAFT